MRRDARDALRRAAPLSECKDCHLPIRFVWIVTTGRAMPVNPQPDERGNVAAHIAGGRVCGFVISQDRRPGPLDPLRFMPHAATCEARQKPQPKPVVDEDGLW